MLDLSPNLALALDFAKVAHAGHKRKFSGGDYVDHPISVMIEMSHYTDDLNSLAAALLHDTIEDTDEDYDSLKKNFGVDVANIVLGLSSTYSKSDPYEVKVVSELDRYAKIEDARVLLLKTVDIFSNLSDYKSAPPKFLRKFFNGKKRLIDVLAAKNVVDPLLIDKVDALLAEIEAYLITKKV